MSLLLFDVLSWVIFDYLPIPVRGPAASQNQTNRSVCSVLCENGEEERDKEKDGSGEHG
jgi:hypothetical protein